ncbi:hypothetical protein MASR2M78_02570 [Treponema sp.]
MLVQTFRPNEAAVALACKLDVEGFYKAELAQRQALFFPPYSRLIRFVARSKDPRRADSALKRLAASLEKELASGTELLGPAECPLSVIAGNERRQIIIRGESMGSLHRAARLALGAYEKEKEREVYIEIDVDPVSLL